MLVSGNSLVSFGSICSQINLMGAGADLAKPVPGIKPGSRQKKEVFSFGIRRDNSTVVTMFKNLEVAYRYIPIRFNFPRFGKPVLLF